MSEFDRYIQDQLKQGNTEIRKIKIQPQDVVSRLECERNRMITTRNNEIELNKIQYGNRA